MTQEEKIKWRRLIARRVFDALRARFPEKQINLVLPKDARGERDFDTQINDLSNSR